jgi:hypothetical protein
MTTRRGKKLGEKQGLMLNNHKIHHLVMWLVQPKPRSLFGWAKPHVQRMAIVWGVVANLGPIFSYTIVTNS